MDQIRVVLCGVGGVGRNVARLLGARPGYRVASACTRNPQLADRDLGELAGVGPMGVTVTLDRDAAFGEPADVVVIATTSFLKEVAADIRAGVEAGLNVVCTAEEMAFPWIVDAELTADLDRLARDRGRTVVGTGANPGFIYEAVALTLTGAAWDVERIRVRRVVNLSRFSATVLRRLGIGFLEAEFLAGVADGTIHGHVGFPQTVALLASRLGVGIERMDKLFEPLPAARPYELAALRIDGGQTAGFVQRALAVADGRPWFEAEFIGHVDPESAGFQPEDVFEIDGYAPVRAVVRPGFNAQLTSAAAIANSLRRVVEGPPGILTVADLPPAFPPPTIRERLDI